MKRMEGNARCPHEQLTYLNGTCRCGPCGLPFLPLPRGERSHPYLRRLSHIERWLRGMTGPLGMPPAVSPVAASEEQRHLSLSLSLSFFLSHWGKMVR